MNPTFAFMPKFFVISGIILILSGLAQAFVRPQKRGETAVQKVLNGAVLRALIFVICGALGVLLGLGVIPMARLG